MYYPTLSFQCLFLRELLAMQFSRCLVGSSGLEPPTSRLSGVRSNQLSYEPITPGLAPLPRLPPVKSGGGKRIRTDDPLLAKQVLYQLSYTPVCRRRPCALLNVLPHLQNHIVPSQQTEFVRLTPCAP